jgi:cold shock CspA family protein
MNYGIVQHFRDDRMYGFIKPDDRSSPDIFFHASNVTGTIPRIGERVAFDLMPDPGKPGRLKALNVSLA